MKGLSTHRGHSRQSDRRIFGPQPTNAQCARPQQAGPRSCRKSLELRMTKSDTRITHLFSVLRQCLISSITLWRKFLRVLNVNLIGPFLLIRKVLPAMIDFGGSIINVTSDAGIIGYPGWGAYGMSKFGLEGLSQTWAAELTGAGVRVTHSHFEGVSQQILTDLSRLPASLTNSLKICERCRLAAEDLRAQIVLLQRFVTSHEFSHLHAAIRGSIHRSFIR
jgi:NAD(P)-dependent dehydrogenase (short-subunit alcohol dehydrogenase family)